MAAIEQAGWEGRDVFHIQMAIEEAVVNAIEHGNKKDPSKKVHLHYSIFEDSVELSVTDQGDGFDHQNVADPTVEEHLDQPRGRGVMLIRELMTEAKYNENRPLNTLSSTCEFYPINSMTQRRGNKTACNNVSA